MNISTDGELSKLVRTGSVAHSLHAIQPIGHFVFPWAAIAVYGKSPCIFHRVMHRLLLGAKWVPANKELTGAEPEA